VALAGVAALTLAQTVRAITYGQPDGNLHPSAGAWMVNWPDGIRTNFASGTLICKVKHRDGSASGTAFSFVRPISRKCGVKSFS
jgi:hypothetical protein